MQGTNVIGFKHLMILPAQGEGIQKIKYNNPRLVLSKKALEKRKKPSIQVFSIFALIHLHVKAFGICWVDWRYTSVNNPNGTICGRINKVRSHFIKRSIT